MAKLNRRTKIFEPGHQFRDFKAKLKDEKIVGYFTNADLTPEKNTGEFLQTQYMLAPIIVDLNKSDHKYIILDYDNPVFMGYVLQEINAVPIYDNNYSKVLAEKKP